MRTTFAAVLLAILLAQGCATERGMTKADAEPEDARAMADDKADAPGRAEAVQTLPTVDRYKAEAARFGSVVRLPDFETTPEEIRRRVDRVVAEAEDGLDDLADQNPKSATFRSTVAALDDVLYPVHTAANRMWVIKSTNTDKAMRDAATEQITRLEQWLVGVQYREDVYQALKAFEQAHKQGRRPKLHGEDRKLLEDTMRDYRRAGLHLDEQTRQRVERLRKRISERSTEFNTNITEASVTLDFSKEELAGVPENNLEQFANDRGGYSVRATVITDFLTVMRNARSEQTRKKLLTARYKAAMEENTDVLNDLLRLRAETARLLGYDSWADYKTEPKMAETGERARSFAEELKDRLEPKFRDELAEMARLKREKTGDPDAEIHHWDWRHYKNLLNKTKYDVDAEKLRVYFPLQRVLGGMFDIYEKIFGLKFQRVRAPYKWHEDLTLYATTDAETGEPMGLFYLDLFPRKGKYNHFAQFGLIDGKRLPNGMYQRPVCALVTNFTPPQGGDPSLLSHDEVETLFHEFGHAMHTILTRADYQKFSGTSVPRDFVEAPSQMLENWVWDMDVLNTFAADYRDPSKKIDPTTLKRMEEAKKATIGVFYRRQLSFALADLWMHGPDGSKDCQEAINRAFREVFLPAPEGTNMAAYWGHMTGYDAGYYGYAWADAIAADMATVFEQAPQGFMSERTGRRLREEIYAPGGSRDVEESIRAFLGRERSLDPFLENLGVSE